MTSSERWLRRSPHRPGWTLAAACAGFWPCAAFAAEGTGKVPSEAVFVAQIVALLLVGRLLGEFMLRIGQPAVVGQLLAGIALGPSLFGWLAPHTHALIFPADPAQKAMINGVAQLGVLLLLLLTGMETDVRLVRAVGRPALSVSLTGIAIPFACGFAVGLFVLPDSLLPTPEKRLITALFMGTALSISSIKIVAMVIDEMHFMRRNLGQIIVASAIIDDTIGWVIVAITFGLARPDGLDVIALVVSVAGTLAFLALSVTVGRRLVAALMRWCNDRLVSELPVVTAILVVMGLMALITDGLGVNTVLGAFVAGVLVGQSPILTKRVERELRGLVIALFAPIFFGLAGLGTDLTILRDPTLVGLTAGLILIASLGKFIGAFLGGAAGGLSRPESLALALGMNARGSTEVIVATIGLSIGALNGTLFTMIVTMAVVTTSLMPPTLRWALARLPMSKDEAERLDREAFEQTGFVSNMERLLLTPDASPSGRLAARLAGLLGGSRHIPVTVMPLGDTGTAEQAGEAAMADVASGAVVVEVSDESEPLDVTLRPPEGQAGRDAVGAEARKGYGLLMIGMEPATDPDGGLHPALADLVQSFKGARAIVVARGIHRTSPSDGPLQILVPATGTEASRRAAELAFAIAQAQGTMAKLVFVAGLPSPKAQNRAAGQAAHAQPIETEILDDMAGIATKFGVETKTIVRMSEDKGAAILGQARRAGDTLVILGVTPRPSDRMPFGALANTLLEASPHSLLLVVNDSRSGVTARKDA